MHVDGEDIPVCNICTTTTDSGVKDTILTEFTKPHVLLQMVATIIAFGMGIDAPNIRHVIHPASFL